MTMIDRLPAMDDAGLANLHANATRLGQSGTAQQQTAAAEMIPAIEAELAAREARKPPRKTPVRKAAVAGAEPKPRAPAKPRKAAVKKTSAAAEAA